MPSLNPKALHRAELPNGLTVLVYRNTTAPVVAINTYVKAGYFDETDDVVGIAHVLEHMFFKGTTQRGVGEIAKATKALGGYLNAHTIYDHTSYYAVLPSSGFAEGLEIQADAYANSVIDAGELARELEVIIQEANRKEDNPSAVTTETLYALLHDVHRIRRWRIGREAALRAFTRDQLLTFYHNFYTPSNTILAIAGDVDIDTAMAHVERQYGALPKRTPVRVSGSEEPQHADFRYRELDGDVAQTHIEFGWRTVPDVHPDTPALDMIARVLSAGRASRLYRAVRDRQLAGMVSASNYAPAQVGVFVVSAETESKKTAGAAQAMWEQVRLIHAGAAAEDEIERSKRLFSAHWARRLETTEGQASHLVEWEAIGGWQRGDEYYDAFMSLRPDDVTRAAQRYLSPDSAGIVIYRPKHASPVASDAAAVRQLLTASPVEPLPPSEPAIVAPTTATGAATPVREEAGVRVYHTPTGIPILIRVRPGSAMAYAGVYAAGGAIVEIPGHAGITALVARTTTKGTTSRTALQIAEASELLGGMISPSIGAESFGWSISVPRDNMAAALTLLADVVQHATLTPEALETERTVLLSDLAQLRDDMYRYPMRLMSAAAFNGHPYGIPATGTEPSVRAISAEDARVWYQRAMLCAPFVIAVVGDVDPDATAALIASAFNELTRVESTDVAAPVWPAHTIESVESRDKAQTALVLAFPSPSRPSDQRFAAHVLSTIASGLGGRFFDELRDRQSLAYTVHSFASEHRFAGAFISYIATSPERESAARDGLLNEFAKLRREPVTAQELAQSKRYILGMHDIRQERGGAVLGDIIDVWLFGTGLRELEEYSASVTAVSADDILRLAAEYFDPDRRVEGIVRGTLRAV
ncbi:MAG TPA: pitrilysin family protein [Gemmatimonadaceae bacterium]|nr:pitrilysin family protein [Gemmatimonadaceae bacterium]